MNSDNFCLKWSNYQAHVQGVLVQLMETESMVDVTLCSSSGEKLSAHKIVLCAASSYFEAMFSDLGDNHPLVILSDVDISVLRCILDFVYHGELNVHAAHLNEVLQVAATLQIRGLKEVSDQLPLLVSSDVPIMTEQGNIPTSPGPDEGFTDFQQATGSVNVTSCCDVDTQTGNDCVDTHIKSSNAPKEPNENDERIYNTNSEVEGQDIMHAEAFPAMHETNWTSTKVNTEQQPRKRKRRESCRKDYSEDQLAAALSDLRSGQLLRETAIAHNIPRSTLYVRAKAEGISIAVTRKGHSGENVNAAVQAVKTGSSLQQASEMYQIPKTVLWRRVKAIGAGAGRLPFRRQMYNSQHWQQAVQALQNGQNLSKVSALFRIPKTTLFREKTRLVEAGKLPWSSLKRRDPQSHSVNHFRLKEAVAACKEGKMSQAVASITYQVPKTTIWRRLQKGLQQASKQEQSIQPVTSDDVGSSIEDSSATDNASLQNQSQFTFIENNSQLPVTYIVEEDFSAASLIV